MDFIDNSFYKNKKVLITGHTGFKGAWLTIWLSSLGAKITGIALEPKTKKDIYVLSGIEQEINNYLQDIRDLKKMKSIFIKEKPEIVFHLAAQPLVLESYNNPHYTYETNIMGTVNILEAIRNTSSVRSVVMVTSDKCYDNRETEEGYSEKDPLGGYDPYSSSKGAAEIVINAYRNSFFADSYSCGISSARAGNVIGGGDWSQNRIIPDCVKAFEKGNKVYLRNPGAIRPWQHVLEPIGGYLKLAAQLYNNPRKYSEAWNFGPEKENQKTVLEITERFIEYYNQGGIDYDYSPKNHETSILALNISKSKEKLDWNPLFDLNETLKLTAEWYLGYQKQDMMRYTMEQIENYIKLWK